VAVGEVPEAHAGLDCADKTDHPTLHRKGLHRVSVPAIRNVKLKRLTVRRDACRPARVRARTIATNRVGRGLPIEKSPQRVTA
jgi:hypothetical protein